MLYFEQVNKGMPLNTMIYFSNQLKARPTDGHLEDVSLLNSLYTGVCLTKGRVFFVNS